MKYRNPILPGYHPDPSICRVGDDFYLVNSTFEFFPGVPIYHSTNLITWELINYCLTDREQVPLDKCEPSLGIFAPTIRYHDGYYFMTTTNVSGGGNFIVHTKDPGKKWSAPAWVAQGGIDPTVFFDDDGTVYFMSTGRDEDGDGIFLCEVDPFTGEMKSESRCISHGCGGRNPEGPHIYKKDGRYYLMLAEGGTEYGHRVTMQRGESIYGPYEPCPDNPILSHQDDTVGEISCTGHADLVEDADGNWWMVCLGTRPIGKKRRLMLHHLGRETFLVPVKWDGDWPLVGNQKRAALEMDGPLPGEDFCVPSRDFRDDFQGAELRLEYNFLRNPVTENYILSSDGGLVLQGTEVTLNDVDSPTWIGIRQQAFDITAEARIGIPQASPDGCAGISAYYNNSYHYDICLVKRGNERFIQTRRHVHDMEAWSEEIRLHSSQNLLLQIRADRDGYEFYFCEDGHEWVLLGSGLAAGLCTEQTCTMTFTGTYIGLFAEKAEARVSSFTIKEQMASCD